MTELIPPAVLDAMPESLTASFVFGPDGGEYYEDGRGPNYTHITGSSDDLRGFMAQVFASQREFAQRIRTQRRSEMTAHDLRMVSRVDKLRVLAIRGATEGERAAARAAVARIEGDRRCA